LGQGFLEGVGDEHSALLPYDLFILRFGAGK